jgi:transposase InsO family protein
MVNSLDFPSLKRKLKIMKIAPFLSFTPMCVDQLNLVPTVDGKNYFVTFIDTHYTVVYLITYKSDVFPMFKDFVAKCEAHFNLKIVNLYCDNGREHLSNEYKDFCSQRGITYHLTVSHTPQQNGISERMNRTITERVRTMVIAADLNKAQWGEAVLTAVNLINISPTKALEANKTPYELWHNKKPKIQYLRVFGSTVYRLFDEKRLNP